MKHLLICVLLAALTTLSSEAQDYYYDGYHYYSTYNYPNMYFNGHKIRNKAIQNRNRLSENNIYEIRTTKQYYTKDSSTFLFSYKRFNEQGQTEETRLYTKKEKLWFMSQQLYNKEGYTTAFKHCGRKGKIQSWRETTYNDSNQVTNNITYNRRGQKKYEQRRTYNDSDQLSLYETYKKNKLSSYFTYTYYENGDQKTAEKYNSKGELQRVWSYKCSGKGKEITAKDTTQVCKLEDYTEDGRKIITLRYTNEKGEASRTVYEYQDDTLILAYRNYQKGFLSREKLYDYSSPDYTTITSKSYHKKGKLKHANFSKYNKQGYLISFELFKGDQMKPKLKRTYEHDNAGNLISEKKFNKKGELEYHNITKYNDKNLKTEIKYFKGDGSLVYSKKTNYTYY